jgi:protein-S-isoprenylcysteine O-methyltransferase Ste14
MKISEQFASEGKQCFRWRSYLPLLLLPIFLASFRHYHYFLQSFTANLLWEISCFLISALGLLVRMATAGTVPRGTSGRNQKHQRATALNTSGLYSMLRNPLYLGNYLIMLGVSLFPHAWYLPIIVSLIFFIYYERIIFVEEQYLEEKFGDEFRAWAIGTPIIVPRFVQHRPSALPFCWRTALRREYITFYEVVAGFFLMNLVSEFIVSRKLVLSEFWAPFFGVATLSFLLVRCVVKFSRLLHREGR